MVTVEFLNRWSKRWRRCMRTIPHDDVRKMIRCQNHIEIIDSQIKGFYKAIEEARSPLGGGFYEGYATNPPFD